MMMIEQEATMKTGWIRTVHGAEDKAGVDLPCL